LLHLEGVALLDLARLETLLEPVHALRAGAVRETLGLHGAAGLALQGVVADLRGGVQRLVDVAGLEDLPGGLRFVLATRCRPPAGSVGEAGS
jgi:hypothetical protein